MREKSGILSLVFSLNSSLIFLFKTHVKHDGIILKQDNKKQGFLSVRFGSINYSVFLCLEWKGGRHYPSTDGGTITAAYKGGGGFAFALSGSQGLL